ncbi:hypothetical protein [Streptosporangium sp. NPDC051022]|uniref:hypothetical protein n=1 Tax=Streptosporangium sp. NPDC051022 TaxID=3155752 RepID=UPI00342FDE4E
MVVATTSSRTTGDRSARAARLDLVDLRGDGVVHPPRQGIEFTDGERLLVDGRPVEPGLYRLQMPNGTQMPVLTIAGEEEVLTVISVADLNWTSRLHPHGVRSFLWISGSLRQSAIVLDCQASKSVRSGAGNCRRSSKGIVAAAPADCPDDTCHDADMDRSAASQQMTPRKKRGLEIFAREKELRTRQADFDRERTRVFQETGRRISSKVSRVSPEERAVRTELTSLAEERATLLEQIAQQTAKLQARQGEFERRRAAAKTKRERAVSDAEHRVLAQLALLQSERAYVDGTASRNREFAISAEAVWNTCHEFLDADDW